MSSIEAFWKSFKNKAAKEGKPIPKGREPFRILKKDDSNDPDKEQAVDPNILKKAKKRKRVEIKNDDFDSLMMLSTPVRFPRGLSLYPTQKLMIVRILAALKNSQNVLAESPTGSGKTMALLSSTCGWLKQYMEEKKEAKDKCPIHGFGHEEEEENDEMNQTREPIMPKTPETVRKPPKMEVKSEPKADLFESQWKDDFIPHSPPGVPAKTPGGRMSGGGDVISFKMEDDIKKEKAQVKKEQSEQKTTECTCLPRVRIYYGTRTHKQIAQVVKEFSRLPYAGVIKHTILASREQSCIHPIARKQQDISSFCKEITGVNGIGCNFKSAMRPRFEKAAPMRDHLMNNGSVVFDMEEIVETLALSYPQLCPYFSTNRILTQDADLIFCPFSYLVDPLIRNSSDVHVKNSIVILDEAHNIEDTCRDAASFSFTEKELDDSLLSIRLKRISVETSLHNSNAPEEFLEKENPNLDLLKEFHPHLLYLEHLLVEILKWVRNVAHKAKPGNEGFKSITMASEALFTSLTDTENGIDLYTPPNTPRYMAISSSFGAITKHNEPELQHMDVYKPSATAIVCIEKWLYFQSFFGNSQYQPTYRLNVNVEPINRFDGDYSFSGGNQSFGGSNSFYGGSGGGSRSSAGPRNNQYKDNNHQLFQNDENPWLQSIKEEEQNEWLDSSTSQSGHSAIFEGCKITVSFWCMSPAISFFDAFSETRSIILASGTLCPMDTLKTELGMEFKQQVEGDQVISKENIFAAVLPIGPHGNRIQCTYRNTSDPETSFYQEVGSIIKYVCSNVPAGILCFLPSYRVLEQLKQAMTQNLSMKTIQEKKVILFEPRRSSELSGVMEEFDNVIFNPKKYGANVNGALMFAVFRGKVSEGIDFADDRARVVISVGIPFPNSKDEQVRTKMTYNDFHSKNLGILTGNEWYTTQAYRALNQALGRCLRHKNDWGAMLMIDERLERQTGNLQSGAVSARVSKWIRSQLKSYPSFKQFNEEFRTFIQGRHAAALVKKEQIKEEI